MAQGLDRSMTPPTRRHFLGSAATAAARLAERRAAQQQEVTPSPGKRPAWPPWRVFTFIFRTPITLSAASSTAPRDQGAAAGAGGLRCKARRDRRWLGAIEVARYGRGQPGRFPEHHRRRRPSPSHAARSRPQQARQRGRVTTRRKSRKTTATVRCAKSELNSPTRSPRSASWPRSRAGSHPNAANCQAR